MKETIISGSKTPPRRKMEIDYNFQIMIIPGEINLFHTTIRNKPDIDYEDYPNAQYLQPDEPYSTDLLNPKYMSISEEAAQSYAHDEDMVRLQYTTSRPIHLVDLYYVGHDDAFHEEGNRKALYLSNKFKVHPNIFPVDGYFRVDDGGSKFSEVYLFRPWSCLYADHELLVNTPPVDDYYGEDDNEQLLLSAIGGYNLTL